MIDQLSANADYCQQMILEASQNPGLAPWLTIVPMICMNGGIQS